MPVVVHVCRGDGRDLPSLRPDVVAVLGGAAHQRVHAAVRPELALHLATRTGKHFIVTVAIEVAEQHSAPNGGARLVKLAKRVKRVVVRARAEVSRRLHHEAALLTEALEREVASDALLQNVGDAAAVAIVVEDDDGTDALAVGVGVPVLVLIGVAQLPPCAPRQR